MNQLLEAHLFDFQGDLYGQWLDVELCHKIRNEMKFPSFDDLKAQIAKDVETAKNIFKTDRTFYSSQNNPPRDGEIFEAEFEKEADENKRLK